MNIIWFGHSAFRLEFGGKVVLVDPFFTGNPGFEGDPVAAAEGATHILITHGHDDHIGDAAAIAARTGATVVANFEVCMWLGGKGVSASEPMNSGGTVDLGGFTATFVRADHSATTITDGVFTPMGNPNGIVLAAPSEPTVYAMGDTDVFCEMELIQDLHRPDILLVPVGDRFTMGGERAAFAVKRYFKPQAAIPCHYGTFPIIDATADRFVAAMEGSGIQVVVPHKGMPVRFSA